MMTKLIDFAYATGLSILVALGHAELAAAEERHGFRPRIIQLNEVPEGYWGFNGVPRRGQIVLTTASSDSRLLIDTFDVHGLGRLCGRNGLPDRNRKFYTLYVETPSVPRTRVFNFNTECNFGSFRGRYVRFPDGTPVDPLFFEPIMFEIVMEADDGFEDLNVDPDFDFQLRGED